MIFIVHAGDLQDISTGGISEFVKGFVQTNPENITVLGVDARNRPSSQVDSIGHLLHRRLVSLQYTVMLTKWIWHHRPEISPEDIFFVQRPEYIVPFLLFRRFHVMLAVHGSLQDIELAYRGVNRYIHRLLQNAAVRRAHTVFVFRRSGGEERQMGNSLKPVRRLPIGVDRMWGASTQGWQTPLKGNGTLTIGYVGRLSERQKRVLVLVPLIKELLSRGWDVRCLVVGDGPDRARLMRLARDEGVGDAFRFEGEVRDRQNVARLMRTCDVGVIPSRFEGVCLVGLEYLHLGIPIVATRCGDIPYYLSPECGLTVDAESTEICQQLADAVDHVLRHLATFKPRVPEDYYAEYAYGLLAEEMSRSL